MLASTCSRSLEIQFCLARAGVQQTSAYKTIERLQNAQNLY